MAGEAHGWLTKNGPRFDGELPNLLNSNPTAEDYEELGYSKETSAMLAEHGYPIVKNDAIMNANMARAGPRPALPEGWVMGDIICEEHPPIVPVSELPEELRPRRLGYERWVAAKLQDCVEDLRCCVAWMASPEIDDDGRFVSAPACSPETCQCMGEYVDWKGENGSREKISAPVYCTRVLSWIDRTLHDEKLIPGPGLPHEFPDYWPDVVKKILRRMARVYVHYIERHYPTIVLQGNEEPTNYAFKHLLLFGKDFGLLEGKDCKGGCIEPFIEGLLKHKAPEGKAAPCFGIIEIGEDGEKKVKVGLPGPSKEEQREQRVCKKKERKPDA